MSRTGFSSVELRAVASLAGLYLVRMLGLFMLLPVLALYARDLSGSTPFLVGLALGIYGLSQACLQLPLAIVSDRIGRKPVIVAGLFMFLGGSLVAAAADSIHGIILGRALQGAGAIASTLMALLADVTRDQNRSKAMAAVGASIGASFAISLMVGPVITAHAGLSGVFLVTAALSVLGMLLTIFVVPAPLVATGARTAVPTMALLRQVLADKQLQRLDGGAFVLHFVMTAIFVAVPLVLADSLQIPREIHGRIYGLLLGTGFVAMVPLMVLAERTRKVKAMYLGAVGLMAVALAPIPLVQPHFYYTMAALWLFFLAFNYLEATLPALMSRATQRSNRGTATGVYSTLQFFGAFCGGSGGGWMLQHFGLRGVFWLCAVLVGSWLMWSIKLEGPQYLRSITLSMDQHATSLTEITAELERLPGVRDVLVVAGESIAYLQVDSHFDNERLEGLPVSLV